MGEYKTITVTNVSLPEDKWQYVIRCLNNLGMFVQLEHGKIVYLGGKSTIKVKYSIDCGAVTTEYGAFRLVVDFYIGPHLSGVRIEEMNYSWRRKNCARSLLPGNHTLYCADVPLTRMYTAKWGSRKKEMPGMAGFSVLHSTYQGKSRNYGGIRWEICCSRGVPPCQPIL